MGRGKDLFLDQTGGMRVGGTPEQFRVRVERIAELEASPLTLDGVEELKRLKGLPPDEWDYEPADD